MQKDLTEKLMKAHSIDNVIGKNGTGYTDCMYPHHKMLKKINIFIRYLFCEMAIG